MRFLISLVCTLPLTAQAPPTLNEILHRVEANYAEVKTIDFTATMTAPGEDGAMIKGKIRAAFKLPDKLRWEFDAAFAKMQQGVDWGDTLMVVDGRNTWAFVKGLNQYMLRAGAPDDHDALRNPTHDPALFVPEQLGYFIGVNSHLIGTANDAKLLPEEKIDVAGKPVECYVIKVKEFDEVETMWVDKARYLVLKVAGGSMEMLFSALKINEPLPDDLFTFTPPPGAQKVDVIKP